MSSACVAYGIKEGEQVPFPFKSPCELGVNRECFNAIQSLFPFLNRVFRGNGNPLIPQKHSSTGDHTNGLLRIGKELFFDPAKQTNTDNRELVGQVEKNTTSLSPFMICLN